MDVEVAVEKTGAGGLEGTVPAVMYVTGEKSDQPLMFLVLYLNLYIYPDFISTPIVYVVSSESVVPPIRLTNAPPNPLSFCNS
jgi:hypothetical protein